MQPHELAQQLDACLPQTQCKRCGFEGCMPYAQAMAQGVADLNRCPPGGEPTLYALASILKRPIKPIDPACGETKPRHIARIEPEHCIGCTLCIAACPVDAIIGASKARHAVLADWCTGCELCIPPCPVDCIEMVFVPSHSTWTEQNATEARDRMRNRNVRLTQQGKDDTINQIAKLTDALQGLNTNPSSVTRELSDLDIKKQVVANALARAQTKRNLETKPNHAAEHQANPKTAP